MIDPDAMDHIHKTALRLDSKTAVQKSDGAPSLSDPVLDQRKVFQPFVDVFNAAVAWHKADSYAKSTLEQELNRACAKGLADMAQNAIDAYLKTLPAKKGEAGK